MASRRKGGKGQAAKDEGAGRRSRLASSGKGVPAAAGAAELAESGYLVANTQPWAKVIIDGKDTGKTTPIAPRSKIALKPGKHVVTFVANGKKFNFDVVIKPAEDTRLIKQLADSLTAVTSAARASSARRSSRRRRSAAARRRGRDARLRLIAQPLLALREAELDAVVLALLVLGVAVLARFVGARGLGVHHLELGEHEDDRAELVRRRRGRGTGTDRCAPAGRRRS